MNHKFYKKELITVIIATITATALYELLKTVFYNPLKGVLYWLVYIFHTYIYNNSILLLIIFSACIFLFLIFKFKKRIKSSFFYILLFILFFSLIFGISKFHNYKKCPKNEIKITYLSTLVKDASANFTSNSQATRDIERGLIEGMSGELRVNDLLSEDHKIVTEYKEFPKYLLNYNAEKKRSPENLTWKMKDCSAMVVWLEIDNEDYIRKVGVTNNLFFLITNSNIDNNFNLKDRVNRLTDLGILDNYSKGYYFAKIYRSLNESMFSSYFTDEGQLEKALESVKNAEKEIEDLNIYLKKRQALINSKEQSEIISSVLKEDREVWAMHFALLKLESYSDNNKYLEAEQELKNVFINNSGINSYEKFFEAFQRHYFYSSKKEEVSFDDFLARLRRGGYSENIYPEEIYGNAFFSILDFWKINHNFDYEAFFNWLNDIHPDNPVVYMFWGKILTLDEKYLQATDKYNKAIAIYSDLPLLKIFYHTAVFNSEKTRATNETELQNITIKYYKKAGPEFETLRLRGYSMQEDEACGGGIMPWSSWCSNITD